MKTEDRRACPSCGNEFSGAMEFCPVCMLRKVLAGGVGIRRVFAERHSRTCRNGSSIMSWCRAKTENRSSWVAVRWASLTRRSTSICGAR